MLVAVECDGEAQGLMAVLRMPRPARLDGQLVYVDYLESAPWNLKGFADPPRVGPDSSYYDLTYFEYTGQQAADWLGSIGELV
jgi:hypothetical protein